MPNCHHYLPYRTHPVSPFSWPTNSGTFFAKRPKTNRWLCCVASVPPDAVKYLLKCFCFSHHPVKATKSPTMTSVLHSPYQQPPPHLGGQGWQFALWDLLVVRIGGLAFLGKWTSEIWLALMHSRCDFSVRVPPNKLVRQVWNSWDEDLTKSVCWRSHENEVLHLQRSLGSQCIRYESISCFKWVSYSAKQTK